MLYICMWKANTPRCTMMLKRILRSRAPLSSTVSQRRKRILLRASARPQSRAQCCAKKKRFRPTTMALRTDVTFRLAEGSSFRPLEPVGKAASSLGMRVTQGRNWSLLWSWRSPWTDAVAHSSCTALQAGNSPTLVSPSRIGDCSCPRQAYAEEEPLTPPAVNRRSCGRYAALAPAQARLSTTWEGSTSSRTSPSWRSSPPRSPPPTRPPLRALRRRPTSCPTSWERSPGG